MDYIFPLKDLEIIGCKEVPVTQPAMPRRLSPIFAVKGSDKVLFPPYTLGEQELIRPEQSTRQDFDDLVQSGEITERASHAALPEHELWLDDEGEFHYEPDYEVRKKLKHIFDSQLKLAHGELRTGSLKAARTHAEVAYSANPHHIDPLVYRAAAEHQMSSVGSSAPSRSELQLTEMIAEYHVSVSEFRNLYLKLVRETSPQKNKLMGTATQKPRPSPILFPELVGCS